MTTPGKLLDPSEVAEYLGVPEKTLAQWRYIKSGPPFCKIGRHIRYRPVDLTEWVESRCVVPTGV